MFERMTAVVAALVLLAGTVQASERDPVASDLWEDVRAEYFGDEPVVFDLAVGLIAPKSVEDAFSVPVVIKLAERLGPVEEVVVLAENNPIQLATRIFPRRPIRAIGMNIRLEQSTPVRAAVRDTNGVWHVGSVAVEVMNPGGCTVSPAGGGSDVHAELGDIAMKRFRRPDRATRLKVGITHPMDTGLAPDADGEIIPAYYVDRMTVADEAGPIADLVTWAALASNPSFFFDLPEAHRNVRVSVSDTKGLAFEALVQ